ncbi:hypothetical protein PCK1_001269 [Pneumocystis canis]|nr:hypothetical protein PCK1_001269 [Pneumocystis canis]
MEEEKSFAKGFLQSLSQKQVQFSENFISPLSKLTEVPLELIQPEIPLPGRNKVNSLTEKGTGLLLSFSFLKKAKILKKVNVTVKSLRGPKKVINIEMKLDDTILNVKQKVSEGYGVELSQIRLLNKGKILTNMKLISEILELDHTEISLQAMIMEKKISTQDAQLPSCEVQAKNEVFEKNSSLNTQSDSIPQPIILDTAFWEDLKSFLSKKLDNNACITVYNTFKQAYAETEI